LAQKFDESIKIGNVKPKHRSFSYLGHPAKDPKADPLPANVRRLPAIPRQLRRAAARKSQFFTEYSWSSAFRRSGDDKIRRLKAVLQTYLPSQQTD